MTIELKNVAVKVEHQNPNDYCVISIGRLNHSEKCRLLNMFSTAIDSLKCVSQYPGYPYPLYQMTVSACLPDLPDFKICDSDVCNISIMDRMITSQTESSDKDMCKRNWFGGSSNSETSNDENNSKEETNMTTFALERCIINDNATVLFWSDGTKTVTKTTPGDTFDPEVGIAMGIAKRVFGSKHKFDKYVNAVVADMYKRNAAAFTDKRLQIDLAEYERIIAKVKEKHAAEKAAYITAKNDPNHEGKLPELHSLKGNHHYRFAKIRRDIILAEIEKRKEKKAAQAKAKAAKAKKKSDK